MSYVVNDVTKRNVQTGNRCVPRISGVHIEELKTG